MNETTELYRLASFATWPAELNVSPLVLAKIGFFYSGTGDGIICAGCNIHLDKLGTNQTLREIHKLKSPSCSFVNGNAKDDIKLPEISVYSRGSTTTDHADTTPSRAAGFDHQRIASIYRTAFERANSKGIFSIKPTCNIDRTNPDFDELRNENVRLTTFSGWPSGSCATPAALAGEGLFYTGVEDRVQCAFCRGYMRNWEPSDTPSGEHKRHFPDCPFVRGLDVGNIPTTNEISVNGNGRSFTTAQLNREGVKHASEGPRSSLREQVLTASASECQNPPPRFPQYADVAVRIQSFRAGKVSPGQTADNLADAGWFYLGPNDKVQCFQCGGNLRDWEPDDDPWTEHRRWYGCCTFIRTHVPKTKHSNVLPTRDLPLPVPGTFRIEPREVKARLDTPKVRAILDMGYNRELVKRTIETRLATTGDDFPNAEGLLDALLQLEETISRTSTSRTPAAATASAAAVTSESDPARLSATSVSTVKYPLLSSKSGAIAEFQSTSISSTTLSDFEALRLTDSSLPVNRSTPTRDAAAASDELKFKSLAPIPSAAQALATAAESAIAVAAEAIADVHSKSKAKRKRNKKKKANAAADDEESRSSPQRIPENRTSERPDETPDDEESLRYVEENRQLRDARTCKVCMDAEVNTVFLPCGHLICCSSCAPQVRNCPVCRTFIRGTVKTFLS